MHVSVLAAVGVWSMASLSKFGANRLTGGRLGVATLTALGRTLGARALSSEPKSKIRILDSQVPVSAWNLALENHIMENVKPKAPVLFMWRNGKTVIIGHNQNPWSECALDKMEEEGVALVRRFSGGGAVYQDLGNTVFSFMYPDGSSTHDRNNSIVLRALEKAYGIKGEASGRNDLVVDGRKFSGFAAKKRGNLWVHHGTVLRDVDMEGLGKYLTPHKSKLESKGVKSVAARVVNLATLNSTITHQGVVEAIAEEFRLEFGGGEKVEREEVNKRSPEAKSPKFAVELNKLMDWNWRFGTTPAFSHKLVKKFPWGFVELHLDVKAAVVNKAVLFTDAMIVELPIIVQDALAGCHYGTKDCMSQLEIAGLVHSPEVRGILTDIGHWIVSEMMQESQDEL